VHRRLVGPRVAAASAVLLAVVFGVAVGLPAAAAAGPTRPRPGFALSLSPTRLVVPTIGGRSTQRLTVTNNGAQPLPIVVAADAFQQALDGTISFTTDGPYSATRWVRVTPPTFTVAAGRSQPVTVDVAVPPHPEPGEHQVGIVFLTAQHQARGNLAVNRGVGAQLLINAPGPVTNQITLGRLRAPWFADGGPVALRLSVGNAGTAHRDYLPPRLLHGTVGGQRVDFPPFTVLRASARDLTTSWDSPPWVCICRARVTTDDGNGHQIVSTAQIIVFPAPATAGLLLLVVGISLLGRGLRRRNTQSRQAALDQARQDAYDQAGRDLNSA